MKASWKAGNQEVTRKVLTREKHNRYTPEQRAQIAKYAAENGPRYYIL